MAEHIVVVLAPLWKYRRSLIFFRQNSSDSKSRVSSRRIVIQPKNDPVRIRIVCEILFKRRRYFTFRNNLFRLIYPCKRKKIFVSLIPAAKLCQRGKGQRIDSAFKHIKRIASVFRIYMKRIPLIAAACVSHEVSRYTP